MTWVPFVFLLFALSRLYQDDKGGAPKWLRLLSNALFTSVWRSYDGIFKPVFGDGERSIPDRDGDGNSDEREAEKRSLLDDVELGS
jgi:hypothetical protein